MKYFQTRAYVRSCRRYANIVRHVKADPSDTELAGKDERSRASVRERTCNECSERFSFDAPTTEETYVRRCEFELVCIRDVIHAH